MKGKGRLLSRLTPLLLVLLTTGAGLGVSRVVSLFLPDYTGQVYEGRLEQGSGQVFYLDEEDQVTLFPWDRFNREQAVSLQSCVEEQGFSSPWEMINACEKDPASLEFLVYNEPCLFLALALLQRVETLDVPASFNSWAETICLTEISGVPMVCLPDTITLRGLSLGFAASGEGIYYYKRSHTTSISVSSEALPAGRETEVSRCIKEAREEFPGWRTAMVQKGLFSPGEFSPREIGPAESSLPESSQGISSSTESLPSQAVEGFQSGNALLTFLEQAANAPSAWLSHDFLKDWLPPSFLENQGTLAEELAQLTQEDYSTLSRNGETLVAFSGSRGTAVFFYNEARGIFTGYSTSLFF